MDLCASLGLNGFQDQKKYFTGGLGANICMFFFKKNFKCMFLLQSTYHIISFRCAIYFSITVDIQYYTHFGIQQRPDIYIIYAVITRGSLVPTWRRTQLLQ